MREKNGDAADDERERRDRVDPVRRANDKTVPWHQIAEKGLLIRGTGRYATQPG